MYSAFRGFLTCGIISHFSFQIAAQTTDISSNYNVSGSGSQENLLRQLLIATSNDTSAVLVDDYGTLAIVDCSIVKTGDTSDMSDSSFSDLNAAVAVQTNGTLIMNNSFISSYGQSANALHLYESGSSAYVYGSVISVFDILSHGLYVAGGYLYAEDSIVSTGGMYSGAISTDKGGGTMVIKNCQTYTFGELAACTYSTGNITVDGLSCTTTKAFAGVIDGNNTLSISNSYISAAPQLYGVYRLFSSSVALDTVAELNITNTHISETLGSVAVFITSNIGSIVYLSNVTIDVNSGLLFNASVDDTGTSGENGGHAWFSLTDMDISGDTVVNNISSIELQLYNTYLVGAINTADTGGSAKLVVDSSSTWNVSASSYLTGIVYSDSDQIVSNGYEVYVNGTAISI